MVICGCRKDYEVYDYRDKWVGNYVCLSICGYYDGSATQPPTYSACIIQVSKYGKVNDSLLNISICDTIKVNGKGYFFYDFNYIISGHFTNDSIYIDTETGELGYYGWTKYEGLKE